MTRPSSTRSEDLVMRSPWLRGLSRSVAVFGLVVVCALGFATGQVQAAVTTVSTFDVGNSDLSNPQHVALDPIRHRLFVVDYGNDRILMYQLDVNNQPTSINADRVIGQPDFNQKTAGLSASRLDTIAGVAYDPVGDRLFVSDRGNERVLIFNLSGGVTNGMSAAAVLGQTNFTTKTTGYSQSKGTPDSLAYDSTHKRLYVGSWGRVLVYDLSGAITNGMNASYVLGQPDFTSGPSFDTCHANRFLSVNFANVGLAVDAVHNRLFVTDETDYRVLVFDVSTITNGENAVNVLGQPNFVTCPTINGTPPNTARSTNRPSDVVYDAATDRLFLANNGRVTIFDVSTITNNESATDVVCLPSFTAPNDSSSCVGSGTGSMYIAYDGIGSLVINNWSGNLVHGLVFYTLPPPPPSASMNNIGGWVWNDAVGWISVSSTDACALGACGDFGARLDPATHELVGWGWNDAVGWICFGTSCKACGVAAPPDAHVDFGPTPPELNGWAKICAEQGNRGWISLNCNNQSATVCTATPYKVVFNDTTTPRQFTDVVPTIGQPATYRSMAFGGNSDGTGLGWFDFSRMYAKTTPEDCSDAGNVDEDLNGLSNCNDLKSCGSLPACAENTETRCKDGTDNDGMSGTDCQDPKCQATAWCREAKDNRDTCTDTVTVAGVTSDLDNDGDGKANCTDPDCIGATGCPLVGEPACPKTGGADVCCNDGVDNDSDGKVDCATDINCQYQAPICSTAWLQFKFGNVYSRSDIIGTDRAGSVTPNATYCLTSEGSITGFTSQTGCTQTGSSQGLKLPTNSQQRGSLGNLDINGILNGKYGPVNTGTDPSTWSGSVQLNGEIYKETTVSKSKLNNDVVFVNGSSATQKGSGLLIIQGRDLVINANSSYDPSNTITAVRQLASFGVIVLKNPTTGVGGNIKIAGNVTKIVGAYFAEGTIDTCASGSCDNFLEVDGLMAAKQFNFTRTKSSKTQGSETFVFDGRSVINPPPGMQDVTKSLPSVKDAF